MLNSNLCESFPHWNLKMKRVCLNSLKKSWISLYKQTKLDFYCIYKVYSCLLQVGRVWPSSYRALISAFSRLTRLDDFHCEWIGSGFFSDVYKVSFCQLFLAFWGFFSFHSFDFPLYPLSYPMFYPSFPLSIHPGCVINMTGLKITHMMS